MHVLVWVFGFSSFFFVWLFCGWGSGDESWFDKFKSNGLALFGESKSYCKSFKGMNRIVS